MCWLSTGDELLPCGFPLAQQYRQEILAILTLVIGQSASGERSKGRHHIRLANQCVTYRVGLHLPWPANNEGHAMACLPRVSFHAT